MALWCLGFAVVNIVFESTKHFADGPYAEYTSVFTAMNWLVVGLKVLGAAVALLSITNRPRFVSPAALSVLVWGAFATLGVYALGSVVQAVGMVSGPAGTADPGRRGRRRLHAAHPVGCGRLRRAGNLLLPPAWPTRGFAVVGVLGAPVVLGLVLLAVPTLLLAGLGLMPAP